jgi:hypothetical protein
VQVVEVGLGDLDPERADLGVVFVGHGGDLLSAVGHQPIAILSAASIRSTRKAKLAIE